MADFIVGRGMWFGVFLLALPLFFLYHELAVQSGWPALLSDFPGIYPGSGADALMFAGNAFVLPLGALGLGIGLLRSAGSRIPGVLLILMAIGISTAIIMLRPALQGPASGVL